MRKKVLALLLAAAVTGVSLSCTPSQRGATVGGLTGAAAGAIIDRRSTRGAIVGGAAGAVIGGLVGYSYEINRYCPACGRRFHYSRVYCPYDNTPLHQIP